MSHKILETVLIKLQNECIKNHLKETFGAEIDIVSETDITEETEINQVAPPGMEDLVLQLKKTDVENPWAVAWSIYNKKYKKAK